ncbi:MAG: type II toxin-antitoxin system RelE/ParE family toxin [Proteobacteria bacterium]|nr:type II toxin-antitoxin system RelE/ParE family toxin [Pseudomonadota bacterium]
MQIRWLEEAVLDLHKLHDYIKQDKPQAATKVAKRIYEAIDLLEHQPGIGRPGRVPHTRELIIGGTPYIIPYRVKGEKLEILRVLHASMPWPEAL